MRLRKTTLAEQADRHHLYQESVQDTETEIDFVEETWRRSACSPNRSRMARVSIRSLNGVLVPCALM